MLLADDLGALFAQAAFVAAVLPVDLLFFLAAGELHLRGVDDDDVIAMIEERRPGRLVLALQQTRGAARDAAQHLSVRVDDVPLPSSTLRGSGRYPCAMPSPFQPQSAETANRNHRSRLKKCQSDGPVGTRSSAHGRPIASVQTCTVP